MVKKYSVYPAEVSNEDIIGDDNFAEKAYLEFGRRIIRGSAAGVCEVDGRMIATESIYRKFLSDININIAIEIGTWRGLSAAILAHYANKVVTIDIAYYQTASFLWAYAGVRHKIKHLIVKDEREKRQFFNDFGFDFAFIDSIHEYDNTKADFECVKKGGRVLFHDYGNRFIGVKRFVDELPRDEVTIVEPFAYWEKNGIG